MAFRTPRPLYRQKGWPARLGMGIWHCSRTAAGGSITELSVADKMPRADGDAGTLRLSACPVHDIFLTLQGPVARKCHLRLMGGPFYESDIANVKQVSSGLEVTVSVPP